MNVPLETPARIVSELTSRGYNADREAVTLLAGADDPVAAVEHAVDEAPADALTLTADHVRTVLADATPDTESAPDTTAESTPDRHSDSTPDADRHTTS